MQTRDLAAGPGAKGAEESPDDGDGVAESRSAAEPGLDPLHDALARCVQLSVFQANSTSS